VIGDDHAEDGVAEELQPLVRVVAQVLGTPRAVDERGGKDLGRGKGDAEAFSQFVEGRDGEWYGDAPLEACEYVVDGVAYRLDVLEVFVLDAEAHAALADFFLDGLGQLDERQGVGLEVVGERIALVDRRGVGLEDVGQAVANHLEDLLAIERSSLDMGFGRHHALLFGPERRAA
jgi:hypothetical protein